jgi:uncharacterized protein (DUF488 family)
MRVWTIGHSNQPLERFLDALAVHRIAAIADVRRYPASRRHPHFGQEELSASLAAAGIDYLHFPDLGGRRSARKDSHNTAWRSAAFRGYADYMETESFAAAVERLLAEAETRPVAIMCAEVLWWQCHRGLIADVLKARGHDVIHIASPEKSEAHPYTSAASIVDGRLSYRGLL